MVPDIGITNTGTDVLKMALISALMDAIVGLDTVWVGGGLVGLVGLLLLVWGLLRRSRTGVEVESPLLDSAALHSNGDGVPESTDWTNHIATGVLVVDSTYRIEHINTIARSLLNAPSLGEGDVLPHSLVNRLPSGEMATTVQWTGAAERTVQVQVRPVRRSTGLYRVLTLHDRTATARTEATLRNTDRLLRAIVQTSVAAVAVVNAQGTITYANQQAESILGLQSSASGTWTYDQMGWTLTPIDADASTRTPLYDVLTTQQSIRGMRCAITWPDGTRKYLSLNAAPLPADEEGDQVVFSVQDVTQRYQAERKLKDEKRFSEAAINSLPGIFYMLDAQGRHRRWNDTLESVTGYSSEDMAHRTLADLVVEDEVPRVREAVHISFAEGTGFSLEADLADCEGNRTPYVFTGAPLTIDDTPYLVGVGLDITAQREREQALKEAREQAEEAQIEAERMNALKTSFLTNMSHEIRTPLTTMIGYARILVEDDDPPKQFAQHIVDGGQRLLSTFSDILTFSQLETGAYTLTPAPMRVSARVQDAISEVAPDAGVTVTTSGSHTSMPARLDAQAVTHIATHLLRNAVAFTEPDDEIAVRIERNEGSTRLVVSDTGSGMPKTYVPHATEPFTQASVGPARSHEGSGLGLAIVEGLAELMRGSVSIDTAEGKGTTVSVQMPHTRSDSDSQ